LREADEYVLRQSSPTIQLNDVNGMDFYGALPRERRIRLQSSVGTSFILLNSLLPNVTKASPAKLKIFSIDGKVLPRVFHHP